MADLFNNLSNNYIYPDLAACAGSDDGSYTFEFLPNQQVGVISGSTIVSAMNLGDIAQPITGWVQQTKILQSGELIFIQGLTKGISYRRQVFVPDVTTGMHSNLYMSVDLSINYYKNFRYYEDTLYATSDYGNGIDIVNALDIAFDTKGIKVEANYVKDSILDLSTLIFISTQEGYSFNITNVEASTFIPDTSVFGETLVEDPSLAIPAFKYPNTAMLGYVLKVTYPEDEAESDKWIEINHVPDYLTYYLPDISDPGLYDRYYKAVDVGLSLESCDADIMSAADYLDYVESNGKWEKVGPLRIWISAVDPDSPTIVENLITGFYVYNPHTFSVKLDYMTIL